MSGKPAAQRLNNFPCICLVIIIHFALEACFKIDQGSLSEVTYYFGAYTAEVLIMQPRLST
jgi:hypothetical protein